MISQCDITIQTVMPQPKMWYHMTQGSTCVWVARANLHTCARNANYKSWWPMLPGAATSSELPGQSGWIWITPLASNWVGILFYFSFSLHTILYLGNTCWHWLVCWEAWQCQLSKHHPILLAIVGADESMQWQFFSQWFSVFQLISKKRPAMSCSIYIL